MTMESCLINIYFYKFKGGLNIRHFLIDHSKLMSNPLSNAHSKSKSRSKSPSNSTK
jgi:hypothetical protein